MTSMLVRGGRQPSGEATVDVLIAEGRVVSAGRGAVADADRVIDATGLIIAPGFIELQINGAFGHDFTTVPTSMWEVGRRLPEWGVTAFAPTIVSTELTVVDEARSVAAAGPPAGYRGAAALGLHVEGPFLAPSRAGAHDPGKLRLPSPGLVAGWSPATGVRIVTLAPELPDAVATVDALVASDVVVSAGHSEATFDEAMAGFAAGVTLVTHLFNAMSGFGHRDPGLAAATLAHPTVVAGLIADGHHVHAGAIRAATAALGPHRTVLVTDAIAATASDEIGAIGAVPIASAEGAPRTATGVLAGSLLTLDTAVRRYVDLATVPQAQAIDAVTSTPASVLRLGDRGRIVAGAVGDVTLLDDDLRVVATIVAGDVLHGEERLDAEGRVARKE